MTAAAVPTTCGPRQLRHSWLRVEDGARPIARRLDGPDLVATNVRSSTSRGCFAQAATAAVFSAVIHRHRRTACKEASALSLVRRRVQLTDTLSTLPVPPGGVLVICGPSGVGKSTLVQRLLGDPLESRLALVVSHTTRSPRKGEVDGVHYHFVQRPEMERMIREGMFLEHEEIHGNLYGTSFAGVEAARAGGRVCILDIDVRGAEALRRALAPLGHWASSGIQALFVCVSAGGGLDELEARLRARSTDDEESIRRRLKTAQRELQDYASFHWDRVILNKEGALDTALQQLQDLLLEFLSPRSQDSEKVVPAAAEAPLEVTAEAPEKEPGTPPKNVFVVFSGLARKLGTAGVDLGQGFPNFDPPDFVVQALRDELEAQSGGGPRMRHQYTRTAGHVPLVEILAERYSGHLGRSLDPMREVAVTVGATGGLFLALHAALSRGRAGTAAESRMSSGSQAAAPREVVALEPFFELYRSQAQGLGAKLRTVPLRFDARSRSFALDADALREALGPQTAALIVNTPHNPTGKAFSKEELLAIAAIVRDFPHICVVSDEVYKYMIFDPPDDTAMEVPGQPHGHVHFASLPGMWDQTITVSSAGKTFGITGWQIGWVVGPHHWIEPIHRYMPNLQFCAPTLMQSALCRVLDIASQPYNEEPSYYAWLRKDYARKRKLMVQALDRAGVATIRSQGGFFLLADIGELCGETGPVGEHWFAASRPDEPRDWTFSRALAAQLGIVTLPVSPFFGPAAPQDVRTRFVRVCFAKTDSTLEEAGRRLQKLKAAAPV